MIYPDESAEVWAKRYSLSMTSIECRSCKKLLDKTIPFAYGNIRGLRSAPHGCPSRYDHTVSRSVSKDDNDAVRSIFELLGGEGER
jgi:hypothetical protein